MASTPSTSSIRFALFFLAEFMNTVTMSGVIVTLFFGGPQPLTIAGNANVAARSSGRSPARCGSSSS